VALVVDVRLTPLGRPLSIGWFSAAGRQRLVQLILCLSSALPRFRAYLDQSCVDNARSSPPMRAVLAGGRRFGKFLGCCAARDSSPRPRARVGRLSAMRATARIRHLQVASRMRFARPRHGCGGAVPAVVARPHAPPARPRQARSLPRSDHPSLWAIQGAHPTSSAGRHWTFSGPPRCDRRALLAEAASLVGAMRAARCSVSGWPMRRKEMGAAPGVPEVHDPLALIPASDL
jgi:hypothetical protein